MNNADGNDCSGGFDSDCHQEVGDKMDSLCFRIFFDNDLLLLRDIVVPGAVELVEGTSRIVVGCACDGVR